MTSHFRRCDGLQSCLGILVAAVAVCFLAAAPMLFAADVSLPKVPGKDDEKPKEKEFKYSAWCAFRDLASIKPPPSKVDPLTEESRPGSSNWEGVGRRGQWTTLVLEVKNTTEKSDYKGTAVISLNPLKMNEEGLVPYTTLYRQEFEVGPGTTKLYYFSVLCPENSWTEPVRIDVSANGRGYDPRYVQLHDLDSFKEDFIAVVSEKSGAFRHLAVKRKAMEDERLRERRVAVVEPQELPTRWHDLMLANLVILDNPSREKMSDSQFEALKSYVQAGGNVLIIAGSEPSRLIGPIEELAGIKVKQMTELDCLDGGASNDVNLALKAGAKLPIVDVSVNPEGSVLVQRNRKTQLVEKCTRYYGPGSVTFLPYSLGDPLLERWEGRNIIPVSIVERARERNLFAIRVNDDDMVAQRDAFGRPVRPNTGNVNNVTLAEFRRTLDDSFAKDTAVQMRKPADVLTFMLFYLLFAVPGNYFIFGWFRRREIAWLAVPVWAAGFSVMASFIGYYGQTGQLTVSEVSVIEAGPGQSSGMARTFLGLYAPHRDDYQIEFRPVADPPPFESQAAPGHLLSVERGQGGNSESAELRVIDGGRLRVERLRVQQRSTRRLEVMHRAQVGQGLDVKARRDDTSALNVEFENRTGFTLYSPVLIYEGLEFDMGPQGVNVLAPGAQGTIENIVRADQRHKTISFFSTPIVLPSARGEHAQKRQGALSAYVKSQIDKYSRCVVCAWVDNAEGCLPVVVGGSGEKPARPKIEGLTLLVVPVTIKSSLGAGVLNEQAKLKYSQDYDPATNQGNWTELSTSGTKSIGLRPYKNPQIAARQPGTTETYLSVQLPSRYQEMADEGLQLQLRFKIEAALPNTSIQPGNKPSSLDGNLLIELQKTDGPNGMEWVELDSQLLTNILGTPQPVEPVALPLSNYSAVQNGALRLRISFTPTETVLLNGKAVIVNLKGINCSVKRGAERE